MALFSRTPRRSPNPEKLAAALPEGPLRDFAAAVIQPDSTPADQLRLLAVDVETTGLDPKTDRLLSIGFVPVDGQAIRLAGAGHLVIRSDAEVGQSATIHRITDDQLAAGVEPAEALTALLTALRGRLLLAHHAVIETGFLDVAMRRVWGAGVPIPTVDTMQLQYQLLTKGFDDEPPPGALRLWGARDQYGLPRYRAHEALTDALACAELYLAQVSELGWQTPLKKLR
ncbi:MULTISPECIES: exonuclease domain-containing protein [unclassified Luteococcus]|uniref:exonuclease domain-containing protein n=1 Tax=unclassified Luteococcus TaxID=2639923 RepID=UPI00313BF86A